MLKGKKVILGVTGSIAAYKAAEIVGALKKKGAEVTVVMTEAATHFITPLTLRTLSRNPVYKNLFPEMGEWNPTHVSLADDADLILIAPATANIIGKIAHGLADGLLSAVVMSTKAPVLIAPAMNSKMYENPIFQENRRKLKKLGYRFIEPEDGMLACGYEGIGKLASVETIVQEATKALRNK